VVGTGEVIVDAEGVLPTRARSSAENANASAIGGWSRDLGESVGAPSGRTRLAIEDWVYCDGTVRPRNGAPFADVARQSWGAAAKAICVCEPHVRQDSVTEQVRVPTENAGSMVWVLRSYRAAVSSRRTCKRPRVLISGATARRSRSPWRADCVVTLDRNEAAPWTWARGVCPCL